jgi:hypothetical protein
MIIGLSLAAEGHVESSTVCVISPPHSRILYCLCVYYSPNNLFSHSLRDPGRVSPEVWQSDPHPR